MQDITKGEKLGREVREIKIKKQKKENKEVMRSSNKNIQSIM